MLLAADEIEALKSLANNWPVLAMIGGAIGWFMRAVAMPLTSRHLLYLDESASTNRVNAENGIKQTAILATLTAEVSENNNRLSDVKQIVSANRACNWTPPAQPSHAN